MDQGFTQQDRPQRLAAKPLKALGLLSALLLAVLVLAGCASSSASSSSGGGFQGVTPATADQSLGAQQPSAGKPKPGGTLNVAWVQEPECIDAQQDWVQNGYLYSQYYEQLVSAAPNNKVVPWLANSWKVSNGGKTYTFQLKKNVKFTDGTPFNAQAVVTNFKDWLNPKNTADYNGYVAVYIADVFKSAVATGPYTVQVNLTKPDVFFLDGLSQYAFGIASPKQLSQPAGVQCDHPVGTGAFKVDKWNHGQDIVLSRNKNWNSAPANERHKGPAYLNKIDWRFVSDNNTRWGAFTSGQSQLLYDIPAVDWKQATSRYQVLRHTTGANPLRFFVAAKWGPLKDVRVRQAVQYAFNDNLAVQTAYRGERIPNKNGSLSPSSPGYDNAVNNYYNYDPAKAEKLLSAAGWSHRNAQGYRTKNGKVLSLRLVYSADVVADSDDLLLFQILQQELQKVGIKVTLIPTPPSQGWAAPQDQPGQWDLNIGYWVGRSAEGFHTLWSPKLAGQPNPNNLTGYFDPVVTKLINELDQTPAGPKQTELAHKIQVQLVEKDAVVLGVSGMQVTLAAGPKLHGLWQSPDVGEPVLSDAWLSK
ncbi:MAG: hypothetical protein J2O48_01135 [Solirubrobacterales bacterium]|nr:hypothetical protein [Solirubrobacterales bacterium]